MRKIDAMNAELAEIKSELEDFGPEGFYSVPYSTIKRDYPIFCKAIIEAFLKSLEIVSAEDLMDSEYMDQAWMNQELVMEEDWPMLIAGAENYYAQNKPLPDWGKLLADYEAGDGLHASDDYIEEPEESENGLLICDYCGEEVSADECSYDDFNKPMCPICAHEWEKFQAAKDGNIGLAESDCREVPCEAEEVISHSEDEKPLDCKMEKAPLSKPLVEEDDMDENVNINVSADRPEELVSLAKAILGGDFDIFDQDFDEPVENIPPVELGAGFEVGPEEEPVDYEDPFEKNPFDDAPVEPEGEEEISEPSEEEDEDAIPEEPVETEFDKEMEAEANKKPADEQPMDMIDGKLVPAKDPKESEIEVDDDKEDKKSKKEPLNEEDIEIVDLDGVELGEDELLESRLAERFSLDDIIGDAFDQEKFELKESDGFSDSDTTMDPECGEDEYEAERWYKSLKPWTCEYNGEVIGHVVAATEEEAYQMMEKKWPEYDYGKYDGVAVVYPAGDDEDISDDDFLEAFGCAMKDLQENKKKDTKLEEAGFGQKLKNKLTDIGNKHVGRGFLGKGKDNVDKIFQGFELKGQDSQGRKLSGSMYNGANNFQEICDFCAAQKGKKLTMEVWANKCEDEYKEIFNQVFGGFKLPVMLRKYRNGELVVDKVKEFDKAVQNAKFEVNHKVDVNVEDAVELKIKKNPTKLEVVKETPINLAGMQLEVKYADGEKKLVDSGWEIDPKEAPAKPGKFKVLASYAGKTVELMMTCIDHELDAFEKYKKEHARDFGGKAEEKPVEEPAESEEASTKAEEKPQEAPEKKPVEKPAEAKESTKVEEPAQPADRKGDKLNRQIKNNKKINQALKDAGFNVDDFYTVYQDAAGRNRKKATDKLNKLRKELFGEALLEGDEELSYPDELDFRMDDPVYDDFGISVVDDEGNEGVLDTYTLSIDYLDDWYERCCALLCQIAKVQPQELTQEIVDKYQNTPEFAKLVKEEFEDDAYQLATRDVRNEEYDSEDVRWLEPEEPEADFDIWDF